MNAKERREVRGTLMKEMLEVKTRRVVKRVWKLVWLIEERGYTAAEAKIKTQGLEEAYPRQVLKLYGLRKQLLLKSRGE